MLIILFRPVMACAISAIIRRPPARNSRQGRADATRSKTKVALRRPILSTIGAATREKTRAEALATVISSPMLDVLSPSASRKRLR